VLSKPFASREKLKSLIVVYIQSESLAAQQQQQLIEGTRATPTWTAHYIRNFNSI